MARDDFKTKTRDILAKRVGYCCSNPNCRKHKIGPNSNPEKATLIGKAAHITAASPKGPRYDDEIDQLQRSSILNGIWLCSNCADLIDKDPIFYSIELLQKWKQSAEHDMAAKISGSYIPYQRPNLDIELIWQLGGRSPNGYSEKNEYHYIPERNSRILISDPPIIYWRIYWNFKLVVYNNSSSPIYNLKSQSTGTLQFDYLSSPPRKNNLPALQNIDLEAKSYQQIEGTYIEADELLRRRVPTHLEGLSIKLSFNDEQDNSFEETFEIRNSEFVKMKNNSLKI